MTEGRSPERGTARPLPDPGLSTGSGARCELCGGPILDRHCKVLCLNCGFHRDCSDP